jgi:hypothetical protein
MKAELVSRTIKMAYDRWRLPEGVIFQNDRGAYFGNIRTLIPETSGQHFGIIRTA